MWKASPIIMLALFIFNIVAGIDLGKLHQSTRWIVATACGVAVISILAH